VGVVRVLLELPLGVVLMDSSSTATMVLMGGMMVNLMEAEVVVRVVPHQEKLEVLL
jgi:hypothetical protein